MLHLGNNGGDSDDEADKYVPSIVPKQNEEHKHKPNNKSKYKGGIYSLMHFGYLLYLIQCSFSMWKEI